MPQKQRKSKNAKVSRNYPSVPDPSTVSYRGRIPTNNAESGIVMTLRRAVQITTNSSGIYSATQTWDPSGCDNWTEMSTTFDEYRVLGIRYEYCPAFTVNSASVGGGLICSSILHTESAPSPGSITEAYSYGDSRVGSVFKPFTREWRMSDTNEADFNRTASTNSGQYTIHVYVDQAGASIAYGIMFVTYFVQFRTLRK